MPPALQPSLSPSNQESFSFSRTLCKNFQRDKPGSVKIVEVVYGIRNIVCPVHYFSFHRSSIGRQIDRKREIKLLLFGTICAKLLGTLTFWGSQPRVLQDCS